MPRYAHNAKRADTKVQTILTAAHMYEADLSEESLHVLECALRHYRTKQREDEELRAQQALDARAEVVADGLFESHS